MGYKGISFPFRVDKRGGIKMSSTSFENVPHIEESITQILNTHKFERLMEHEIYSDLKTSLFSTDNPTLQTMIKYDILDALKRCETRITTDIDKIAIEGIELENYNHALSITIEYLVVDYGITKTSTIVLGGVENNVYNEQEGFFTR